MNCGIIELIAASLKAIGRVSVLGDDAKPRGITVESVYRTERQLRKEVSEVIPERIALMLDGRMNWHTAGFIEHDEVIVLEGDRNIQRRIWLKSVTVGIFEYNDIAGRDHINTSDEPSGAGDTVFDALELSDQPA